jgi:hypothetical protein
MQTPGGCVDDITLPSLRNVDDTAATVGTCTGGAPLPMANDVALQSRALVAMQQVVLSTLEAILGSIGVAQPRRAAVAHDEPCRRRARLVAAPVVPVQTQREAL